MKYDEFYNDLNCKDYYFASDPSRVDLMVPEIVFSTTFNVSWPRPAGGFDNVSVSLYGRSGNKVSTRVTNDNYVEFNETEYGAVYNMTATTLFEGLRNASNDIEIKIGEVLHCFVFVHFLVFHFLCFCFAKTDFDWYI